MKIGMITFHKADNFGAVLQASALQKYLTDFCGECEMIDYIPNNQVLNQSIFRKVLHYCKNVIFFWISVPEYIRHKKFDAYRKQYYGELSETYSGDQEIESHCKGYDVIVSGSDQILNTTLTGNSKAFYLHFENNTKKVSYASSFGRVNISLEEKENIHKYLTSFSDISVRESSARELISREIGVMPEVVLDPVFLQERSEWDDRCYNSKKMPDKYIFVYSMEQSDVLNSVVKQIACEERKDVIVVCGGRKVRKIKGKKDTTCGPAEFLSYVKKADVVITNSFHGCAFSLIFGKKFYCIAHSSRNARLENLLQLINRENALISCNIDNYKSYMIDGERFFPKLDKYIENSKQYLKRCILQNDK